MADPARAPAPAPPFAASGLEVTLQWAHALRADGKALVTTNGCFDLFHAGHLETLTGARALGDALVVLVNSDASVRSFKGPDRPYLAQDDRAALLAALRMVDRVVLFDDETPLAVLAALRPEFHVKGGSFLPDRVAAERALLESWGGRLVCLPLREGVSSTLLVERIRRTG